MALISNFSNVAKTIVTGAIKTLRTLKGALIATGIGAFALSSRMLLQQHLTSSEEGQNKFAKLMYKTNCSSN